MSKSSFTFAGFKWKYLPYASEFEYLVSSCLVLSSEFYNLGHARSTSLGVVSGSGLGGFKHMCHSQLSISASHFHFKYELSVCFSSSHACMLPQFFVGILDKKRSWKLSADLKGYILGTA